MTGLLDPPPAGIRRALRRVLPGPRGAEVLDDLDRAYGALRRRHTRRVAAAWYLLQLLRPATWRLAWALRRIHAADDRRRPDRIRTTRGPSGIGGLSLDVKIAWRMLARSPGLSVVGVLGLALGTAVGIALFVFLSGLFYPTLPLEEGDRIVALSAWDSRAGRSALPSVHDFVTWRAELRSVEQVAAASMGERALVTGDAQPQPVRTAAMTAAAFQVARVPPLLGRSLEPEDERPDAARVAVIGYDLWQARFGADPGVLGRPVLLDGVEHTVVGVMPPGFRFPRSEALWTALRADPTRVERGEGPQLFVFGRLAPGATHEEAQAELTVIGARAAAAFPETDGHLRLQVLPYTYPLDGIQDQTLWDVAQVQLMVTLLLVGIAVNVAVLVYARTAMRQGEIAVRSALGASRRRVVSQLFVEALILSGLGAALGLGLAHVALGQIQVIFDSLEGVGFWVDHGLQLRSVVFAVALAVLSAVIVGVLPGIQSTGGRLSADLRRLGGGASVRLGRGWTALILAQVAVAVIVLPTALHLGHQEIRMGAVRSTFPAHEFLTARLGVAVQVRPGMDGEGYRREVARRFADRLPELERRLEAEPQVVGVTFEGRLPGRGSLVEIEGVPEPAEGGGHPAVSVGVATDYFALLGARVLTGRALRAPDIGEAGVGLVVNEAFTRTILRGEPALGRRVRFLAAAPTGGARQAVPGPWLEIVGVVQDLQASALDREIAPPFAYYAVAPGDLQAANLLVRVRNGDADGFGPRLRDLIAALDPDLRVASVENLSSVRNPRYLAMAAGGLLLVLITVLLLSAAGIHALMSLTVTRRRKEIGVRTALGARPGRLLASLFSRAAWQLGLGGLLGSLPGAALLMANGLAGRAAATFLCGVAVLMLATGLMATLGPARRGLGIQPMEVLREE